jgi:high-affinity Fe2+/Pb2+ permease
MVAVGAVRSGVRARQVRIAGAAGIALFWALISLPTIGKNTALGVTAALVAAGWVVWTQEETRPTWPVGSCRCPDRRGRG